MGRCRIAGALFALCLTAWAEARAAEPGVGPGVGTAIIVGGEAFDVGRPVVLWSDPDRGFNGYHKRCIDQTGGCCDADSPRFGERKGLKKRTAADLARVVSQFVLHFDGCVNSRSCFKSMHNRPRPGGGPGCGLSAHFMVDADGTIYQTLDLVERAYHAEQSNNASIGVEICNRGKVNPAELGRLPAEYRTRPTRRIVINGAEFHAYDFRPEQYDTLIALTRTLLRLFPRIKPVIPEKDGQPLLESLADPTGFDGIVGHLHVDKDRRKWDPGALDWGRLLRALRGLTLPVRVGSYLELPRTDEGLSLVKRSLYANAEDLATGFFPLGPGRLWHSGVHLRTAPGSEVVAVTAGRLVAARRAAGPAARSWVLTRHEVDAGGTRVEFFALLAQVDLPEIGAAAGVPWVQALAQPDRAAQRRRYEEGEILLLDERVDKGEPVGRVGLVARGPEQGPEIHFETFSATRLPEVVDAAFRHLNASADGALSRRADLLSPVDANGDFQADAAELKRFFRQGELGRRQTFQRLAVRHVHEWSARGAAELLAGGLETSGLSAAQRQRVHDVAVGPYVFLTPEVARHAHLPENGLVYSYHPLTLLLQLASASGEGGLVWSGGRVLSDRAVESRPTPFPFTDWDAAPETPSYVPLFGPPIGLRRAPKLTRDIPLIELPSVDER
jgi:N-acetyl-anhydromuramyl-L-alanine amidase AmpD